MFYTYQELKIFLAYPSDVQKERKMAEQVIQKLNESIKDTLNIRLEPICWDKFTPITPNLPEEQIQDIINKELKKCNIFLLVLFKRFGTEEEGQTKSNIEREIDLAIKLLKEHKKIMLLSYFRELPIDADPGHQRQKVEELRDRLKKTGVFFKDYKEPSDFMELFTHDIYRTVIRFRMSTHKQELLKTFWRFGIPDNASLPRLSIIYPSVSKVFLLNETPDRYWKDKLLPPIGHEEYRALQKVISTLRLIGFINYNIYTTNDIPSEIKSLNRLWVCLPRNTPGLTHIEKYYPQCRFKFIPRRQKKEGKILWKKSIKSKDYFLINSPLSKYLELQRNVAGGEWNSEMKRIIAKDFAIIARLNDKTNSEPMKDGFLKDYLIAGIRGLGTWGAAWYIDRRYNIFAKYEDKEDIAIELLLEVTYKDGYIFDVIDVSDKPESYFKEQNNINFINKVIKNYRAS